MVSIRAALLDTVHRNVHVEQPSLVHIETVLQRIPKLLDQATDLLMLLLPHPLRLLMPPRHEP